MNGEISEPYDRRKVIFAGILGNTLELYDYTIYAFFASILAVQFFPSENVLISLMATYGVYASGFLVRPLGALLLGVIGDRYGRKKVLEISILLMAIPTLCMGLLPTYYQIGIVAPILLTVFRMMQGFSVGGEIVGSYTFLVEHAKADQRGIAGTWCIVGASGGKWIGSFVALLMTLFVSSDVLEQWGWRIPFLAGIVFAAGGYYIRKGLLETPVFQELQKTHHIVKSPIKESFKKYGSDMFTCMSCVVLHTTGMNLIYIYFPVYFKTVLGFSYTHSLLSNLAALTIGMIILPLSGLLSDRIGRRPILLWGSIALTLLVYPAFTIIAEGNIYTAIPMHLLLASVFSFMHAPYPTMMIELFPPQVRCTAVSIAYNICIGIFGGITPLMSTWLIDYLDSPLAPAWWIIASGMITIFATYKIKESNPVFIPQSPLTSH